MANWLKLDSVVELRPLKWPTLKYFQEKCGVLRGMNGREHDSGDSGFTHRVLSVVERLRSD